MDRLKNCFLFFSIFLAQGAYCTVVSAERWELCEKEGLSSVCFNVKTILLLSDSHKGRQVDLQQLKDLLHYLRTKKKEASLIVEDPYTFNDKKLSWSELGHTVRNYSMPMRNSASLAYRCGVLATSVEFRPDTSRVYASGTSIKDIIDTTDEQVEIIAEYDDGPLLNDEYEKYINRYNSVIAPSGKQLFKNIAAQNCSLEDIDYDQLAYPEEADQITNLYRPPFYSKENTLEKRVAKVITDYAREVIDFKILHALVEHAKKGVETTIIYAGGGHLDAIKPILKKLGYHFSRYPDIEYGKDGHLLPLNVAEMLQILDPKYDPNEQLPKETIDYFFKYKEAEENNPCFRTRSMMKMFVAAADSLQGYRNWKKECPRLEKALSVTLAAGALSVLWCVIKICCKAK